MRQNLSFCFQKNQLLDLFNNTTSNSILSKNGQEGLKEYEGSILDYDTLKDNSLLFRIYYSSDKKILLKRNLKLHKNFEKKKRIKKNQNCSQLLLPKPKDHYLISQLSPVLKQSLNKFKQVYNQQQQFFQIKQSFDHVQITNNTNQQDQFYLTKKMQIGPGFQANIPPLNSFYCPLFGHLLIYKPLPSLQFQQRIVFLKQIFKCEINDQDLGQILRIIKGYENSQIQQFKISILQQKSRIQRYLEKKEQKKKVYKQKSVIKKKIRFYK